MGVLHARTAYPEEGAAIDIESIAAALFVFGRAVLSGLNVARMHLYNGGHFPEFLHEGHCALYPTHRLEGFLSFLRRLNAFDCPGMSAAFCSCDL